MVLRWWSGVACDTRPHHVAVVAGRRRTSGGLICGRGGLRLGPSIRHESDSRHGSPSHDTRGFTEYESEQTREEFMVFKVLH